MEKSINLVISKGIKKPDKLLKSLSNGKIHSSFFVVSFSKDSKRLEIINSWQFVFKLTRKQNHLIVALLKTEKEALEYIRRLTEISYKKYNDFKPILCVEELSLDDIEFLSLLNGEE